jgi:squalene synthase HpnC
MLLRTCADDQPFVNEHRTMREVARDVGRFPLATQEASAALLRDQEQAENFPVALRLLPATTRRHLSAIYDVARVVDDLGDQAEGDRTALLEDFRRDLDRVWDGGEVRWRVLRQLQPTVQRCQLTRQPFVDLVLANLQDQQVRTYETFEELRDYCRLSADPVGRLVLAVFGVGSPRTEALSDQVCTALQLLEFWQDVAEDRAAGRVYLPQQTMRAHGVGAADLDARETSPALRRALAYETRQAESLLRSGSELIGLLHGWARVAVAGYVAGGRATAHALRRAHFDVLAATPRPRATVTLRHAAGLLAGVSR